VVVPVVRPIDREVQILNRWSRGKAALRDFGVNGDMIICIASAFCFKCLEGITHLCVLYRSLSA
jgi:hypothetical protein